MSAEFEAALLAAQSAPYAYLSDLSPLILATCAIGRAHDSRSFARGFEVAHALVLRDVRALSDELGLLTVEDRGERSGRLHYTLTPTAHRIFEGREVNLG